MIVVSHDRGRFVGRDQVYRTRNYPRKWIGSNSRGSGGRLGWSQTGDARDFSRKWRDVARLSRFTEHLSVALWSFSSTPVFPVRSSKHVPLNISIEFFRVMKHRMSVFRLPILRSNWLFLITHDILGLLLFFSSTYFFKNLFLLNKNLMKH